MLRRSCRLRNDEKKWDSSVSLDWNSPSSSVHFTGHSLRLREASLPMNRKLSTDQKLSPTPSHDISLTKRSRRLNDKESGLTSKPAEQIIAPKLKLCREVKKNATLERKPRLTSTSFGHRKQLIGRCSLVKHHNASSFPTKKRHALDERSAGAQNKASPDSVTAASHVVVKRRSPRLSKNTGVSASPRLSNNNGVSTRTGQEGSSVIRDPVVTKRKKKGSMKEKESKHLLTTGGNQQDPSANTTSEEVTIKRVQSERIRQADVISCIQSEIACISDISWSGKNSFYICGLYNSRVDFMDPSLGLTMIKGVTGCPRHLAATRNYVVMSAFYSKAVLKVSMASKSEVLFKTATTSKLLDWGPRGLCFTASGDILVCLNKFELFHHAGKVARYDRHYKLIKEIEFDANNEKIYGLPYYVVENKNGDVCVSDEKKRAVIVTNAEGDVRFSYVGNVPLNSFNPCGIAVDSGARIIILTLRPGTIQITDADGNFLFYLFYEEMDSPLSVTVDDVDNMFVCDKSEVKIVNLKSVQ